MGLVTAAFGSSEPLCLEKWACLVGAIPTLFFFITVSLMVNGIWNGFLFLCTTLIPLGVHNCQRKRAHSEVTCFTVFHMIFILTDPYVQYL